MLSALLYLQAHSFRNQVVSRCKRLRQPKYLVGAIAGFAYFYFYFFRFLFVRRPHAQGFPGIAAGHPLLLQSAAALALLVVVVLAWVIPHERAALTFSEAEVAFLFPAPISRRGLIHFKLVRSQLRILFTVLLLDLFSARMGGSLWMHAVGLWLVFSTLNLHFLGSSFARTLLLERGISNTLRRAVVLGLALGLAAGVVVWARRTMPALAASDTATPDALLAYAERVLTCGPALFLLYPFRLLVRPFFAGGAQAFLVALGPAILLVALHYIWVIYSNVAFEEASIGASQRLAARIAAVRSGNWQAARTAQKGKRPWFTLAPTGPPATALFWKNLIGAGQAVTWRLWLSLGIICVALYAGFGRNPHGPEVFVTLVGVLLVYSLFIGPQFLRQDFRQDLPQADALKTFPMRGWQIALGEILAPVIILAAVQWLLLFFGILFQAGVHSARAHLFLAGGLGAVFLLPAMDALLLLIPNAAVLLFPSWIQAGKDSPRGIEATGQRLVFFFGQVLVLAISLVPAAIAYAIVFYLLRALLGPAPALTLGAMVATVVLVVEAALGVLLLGKLFERFDLSAESNVS
jgi:Putative ABC exporter